MGRASGGPRATAVTEMESGFAALFGARRGGARPAVAVSDSDYRRLHQLLERSPHTFTRDDAELLAGIFADPATQSYKITLLLRAMERLPPAPAVAHLHGPLRALRKRLAHGPVDKNELKAALEFVGKRSRRWRERESPLFKQLVDVVAARYRAGELAPLCARDIAALLLRQPEYAQLEAALLERGQDGESEALRALRYIEDRARRRGAISAVRQLAARITDAGLPAQSRAQAALRVSGTPAAPRAAAVPFDRAMAQLASAEFPPLRGFVDGQPYLSRHLLDAAVANLPTWEAVRTGEAHTALARLLAEVPATALGDAQLVAPIGWPLHAVVVERLPDWTQPRSNNRRRDIVRYGEHVALGIYVYDEEADTWYKRGLHGRCARDAVGRWPFSSARTALATAEYYIRLLSEGTYSSEHELGRGYPRAFVRANQELATRVSSLR